MAMRFGRGFDDPERRIEQGHSIDSDESVEDRNSAVDAKMHEHEKNKGNGNTGNGWERLRKNFMKEMQVTPQVGEQDALKAQAYRELDIARQNGDQVAEIASEEKILELERTAQEKRYIEQIRQIKERRKAAMEKGDQEELKATSELRKKLIRIMDIDKLKYEIKKLEFAQKKVPDQKRSQEIERLKKELELLEEKDITK